MEQPSSGMLQVARVKSSDESCTGQEVIHIASAHSPLAGTRHVAPSNYKGARINSLACAMKVSAPWLLSPFSRLGSGGPDTLSHWPKATQLHGNKIGF